MLAFIGAQRRSLTGRARGLSAVFPQEGPGGERTELIERGTPRQSLTVIRDCGLGENIIAAWM